MLSKSAANAWLRGGGADPQDCACWAGNVPPGCATTEQAEPGPLGQGFPWSRAKASSSRCRSLRLPTPARSNSAGSRFRPGRIFQGCSHPRAGWVGVEDSEAAFGTREADLGSAGSNRSLGLPRRMAQATLPAARREGSQERRTRFPSCIRQRRKPPEKPRAGRGAANQDAWRGFGEQGMPTPASLPIDRSEVRTTPGASADKERSKRERL